MKKLIIIVSLLVLSVNFKAEEPSKYAVGMLLYLDESINLDKVDKSDFIEYMTYEYDYSLKRINPKNLEVYTVGFEFYKVYNDKWSGIIAILDNLHMYRLNGFLHDDFSGFFSDYKYKISQSSVKLSNKEVLKMLEKLDIGVDFRCLYKAHKEFDCAWKEKYPCVDRAVGDFIIIDNCFK